MDSLVRYIGGPHIAAHRNIAAIQERLQPGVKPEVLEKLIHGYEYGAPKCLKAISSDENFMVYYRYGNHKSCDLHPEEYKKVMVKDSKRGNAIFVDPDLLPFIPDLHLTPQGIVDVYNKWKSSRNVFDSSFRPEYRCKAINDWVDAEAEGMVSFIHSFRRFLQEI